MKLLFISSRDVSTKFEGAPQCTNRNYNSFCSLLGKKSVDVINVDYKTNISFKEKALKRINLLFGLYWGLSYKKINHIIEVSKEYEFVFIDSSLYGIIAFFLNRANYKGRIICHFHNVEFVLRLQKAIRNPLSFWEIIIVYINEKSGYEYADYVVALNKRDSNILQKTFGLRKVNVIPISMMDAFRKSNQNSISIPPTFLFFGSNHFANYQGIKWFIRNVLNHVDIKLQIAGSGMEKFKKEFSNPKIEILGFVSDLSELIVNADFILSPIFKGSGMKVKTCEALMFGKNIIGTKESFEGYEIDPKKAGAICNSKNDFIDTINSICSKHLEKFNTYSRKCYEEKYSFQVTLVQFKELIS
jgi:polysaccharide biosynthesis protein PslH